MPIAFQPMAANSLDTRVAMVLATWTATLELILGCNRCQMR